MADVPLYNCLLVPFLNRFDQVSSLLDHAVPDLLDGACILLIDDGSDPRAEESERLRDHLADRRIVLLRHEQNQGPAAARNTGLAWCREQGIRIVILMDSDCIPAPGLVRSHLDLHERNRGAAAIGGAIEGRGEGYWATLDNFMSWFTSIPDSPEREVKAPYHLPTTNLSLKMETLPDCSEVFETRLKTGEDVAFFLAMRRAGHGFLFCPAPQVQHQDRDDLNGFVRHQFRWGLHTFMVRFGIARRGIVLRLGFALAFLPLLPVYVGFATYLNVRPWMRTRPCVLIHLPIIMILYVIKGFGVFIGALWPRLALNNG